MPFALFCRLSEMGPDIVLIDPVKLIEEDAADQDHGDKGEKKSDHEHTLHQRPVILVGRYALFCALYDNLQHC